MTSSTLKIDTSRLTYIAADTGVLVNNLYWAENAPECVSENPYFTPLAMAVLRTYI